MTAHRVSVTSYCSIVIWSTGMTLHHQIAYPKVAKNLAISQSFEVKPHLLSQNRNEEITPSHNEASVF